MGTIKRYLSGIMIMIMTISFSIITYADGTVTIDVPVTVDYAAEQEFLTALNTQRVANGKTEVPRNGTLMAAAEERAAELILSLSHARPDGTGNREIVQKHFGVTLLSVGEDILYNASIASGTECFQQFYEETTNGHSADMMASGALACGVGIVRCGGVTYCAYLYMVNSSLNGHSLSDLKSEPYSTSGTKNKVYHIECLESLVNIRIANKSINYAEKAEPEILFKNTGLGDNLWGNFYIPNNECTFAGDGTYIGYQNGKLIGLKTGTGTITVTWKGKTFSLELTVYKTLIATRSDDDSGVTFDKDTLEYTGSVIHPTVTKVVDQYGNVLTENVDYTVIYRTSIEPGQYKVSIKGAGSYDDTMYVNKWYTIVDSSSGSASNTGDSGNNSNSSSSSSGSGITSGSSGSTSSENTSGTSTGTSSGNGATTGTSTSSGNTSGTGTSTGSTTASGSTTGSGTSSSIGSKTIGTSAGTGTKDSTGTSTGAGTTSGTATRTTKTTKGIAKGKTVIVKGIIYKALSSKTVSVKAVNKRATKITVPNTVTINGKKYSVTEIGSNAFKNRTKLKTVVLGKNITEIGEKAFYGCTKLKTIVLGKSITCISKKAFYGCVNLTKLIFKSSKISTISTSAFKKCGYKNGAKLVVDVPNKSKKSLEAFLHKGGLSKNAKIK